jgi:putative SOS response-associated peptidase YedK
MCYDIKANLKSLLKKAKYFNDDPGLIEILEEKVKQLEIVEFHHVSGFQHPRMPVVTNDEDRVHNAVWGLLPFWTKDLDSGLKFYNKTLNARSETIFEKPSFRASAKNKRCLIAIDGFYEHHHYKGKTYPFHIRKRSGEAMLLAGLWSNWRSKDGTTEIDSFAIVTTQGNPLLARIHNNPKLKGPRMPVILPDELADTWLKTDVESDHDKSQLIRICCRPYDEAELEAFSVPALRGKAGVGNSEAAHTEKVYDELDTYEEIIAA